MSDAQITALQAIMVEEGDLDLFPDRVVELHREGRGLQARQALQRHLRGVRDPHRSERIRHYLSLLRLWAEPGVSPPGMFTFNGIGTRLYGAAQPQGDGTHIATLWLTFLFLPVVPADSYVVQPAEGGGWYFLARSPHPPWVKVPLYAWGAALAAMLVAVASVLVDGALRADLIVYNGFSDPIEVRTAVRSWTIGPGRHVEARLRAWPTDVEAGFVGESPFEVVTLDLGSSTWRDTVYNVGARAMLVVEPIAYGPDPAPGGMLLFGAVNVVDPIDHVFTEPPASKTVDEGQTVVVSHLYTIPEENPANILDYLYANAGPGDAMAYAASAARDGIDDRAVLSAAMASAAQAGRTPVEVCEEWLTRRPDRVERHRFCQDVRRRHELLAVRSEYARLAEKHADSAMYAYLAARVADTEAGTRWIDAALERDPAYARAHFARAYDLLILGGDTEVAEQALRRAFELDPALRLEGVNLLVYILEQQGLAGDVIAEQLPDVDTSVLTMAHLLQLQADPGRLDAEWARLEAAREAAGASRGQFANTFANVALVAGDLDRVRAANAEGGGMELWLALSDGATEADRAWSPSADDRYDVEAEVLLLLLAEEQGRDTTGELAELQEGLPDLVAFLRSERAPTAEVVEAALRDVPPELHGVVWFLYFRRTGDPALGRMARRWALPNSLPYFAL